MLRARLFATRGECLFVDRVDGREVWAWWWRGLTWLGQSRFGMWMEHPETKGQRRCWFRCSWVRSSTGHRFCSRCNEKQRLSMWGEGRLWITE